MCRDWVLGVTDYPVTYSINTVDMLIRHTLIRHKLIINDVIYGHMAYWCLNRILICLDQISLCCSSAASLRLRTVHALLPACICEAGDRAFKGRAPRVHALPCLSARYVSPPPTFCLSPCLWAHSCPWALSHSCLWAHSQTTRMLSDSQCRCAADSKAKTW